MMGAVADNMKASGVKTVGYIGFADSWATWCLPASSRTWTPTESSWSPTSAMHASTRASRVRSLKLVAANPDAIVVGGSGTPGALPQVTLIERGYKGKIYHNHGVINKDFLRVGGKSLEGAFAPTGPVMVAEQLPDSNWIKKSSPPSSSRRPTKARLVRDPATPSLRTRTRICSPTRPSPRPARRPSPVRQSSRQALRDALEATKEVVGTHGVYNMKAGDHAGVDKRAVVLAAVRVENGDWKLVKVVPRAAALPGI